MEVAHANDVELEGACGGELACSTCHLIFEKHIYDTLPPKQEEEDDMLDLALEVTETYVKRNGMDMIERRLRNKTFFCFVCVCFVGVGVCVGGCGWVCVSGGFVWLVSPLDTGPDHLTHILFVCFGGGNGGELQVTTRLSNIGSRRLCRHDGTFLPL